MRQYTVVFMEQRIGVPGLRPLEGDQGVATFMALDDERALAHIGAHLLERLRSCARAELSSMHIMKDPTANGGQRLVDDTHANPRFQDTYVKYNVATKAVEVDWDSTRTILIADLPAPPA
jgi:hypothetical protein